MSNEKTFVKTAGLIALIGGIATLLLHFVKWGLAISALNADEPDTLIPIFVIFGFIIAAIRVLAFIYGIMGANKFSKDPRVNSAASILLIVAFGINVIPYFGIVADVLSIVAGGLFLASVNKLDQPAPDYDAFGMPINPAFPQNPANGFANNPSQEPQAQDYTNPAPTFNPNTAPQEAPTPQNPVNGFANGTVQEPLAQDNAFANPADQQAKAEPSFNPQAGNSENHQ